MHRNMYILKIPLHTYLPLQKDNGTKPWQMIVNLVLQETLARFPGFALFKAKFETFPSGKGVLLRKFFFSLFIQTGRTGSRVMVGCGRRRCTSLLQMIQSKIRTCLSHITALTTKLYGPAWMARLAGIDINIRPHLSLGCPLGEPQLI